MSLRPALLVGIPLFCSILPAKSEVTVSVGYSPENTGFAFPSVAAPANNDAATEAKISIVDGDRDSNGADLAVLQDGKVPTGEDQPGRNFFFRAGTNGGRIQLDLNRVISVKQVSSYSWHHAARAAQVYKLYGAEGTAAGFDAAPKKGTDPASKGWTLVASVDTRAKEGNASGQHGVTIAESKGTLGKFRYLLLDISQTEDRDAFGNTFYSEIDVIDADGPAPTTSVEKPILHTFETSDGKYRFTIDATGAPDLLEWSEKELKPVVQQWYPKIVALLPSDGYEAPKSVRFRYRSDMRGTPASAAGAGVNLNTPWFRGQLKGEARGAVVHELVHVVQNYWGRGNRGKAAPSWVVEGIADYVRWFLYEPESRGAEITKGNLSRASYDASYRVTANFFNWIAENRDKNILQKLNAASREGKYDEQLWKEWTGKALPELGAEWKGFHEQRLNGGAKAP